MSSNRLKFGPTEDTSMSNIPSNFQVQRCRRHCNGRRRLSLLSTLKSQPWCSLYTNKTLNLTSNASGGLLSPARGNSWPLMAPWVFAGEKGGQDNTSTPPSGTVLDAQGQPWSLTGCFLSFLRNVTIACISLKKTLLISRYITYHGVPW